jgi:hypothetical protein
VWRYGRTLARSRSGHPRRCGRRGRCPYFAFRGVDLGGDIWCSAKNCSEIVQSRYMSQLERPAVGAARLALEKLRHTDQLHVPTLVRSIVCADFLVLRESYELTAFLSERGHMEGAQRILSARATWRLLARRIPRIDPPERTPRVDKAFTAAFARIRVAVPFSARLRAVCCNRATTTGVIGRNGCRLRWTKRIDTGSNPQKECRRRTQTRAALA